MVNEMLAGLVQIKIFKRRRDMLIKYSKKLNQSLRANLCFWIISRSFMAYVNYFGAIIMTAGWIIGVAVVTPQTAGLYGVSVVFLVQSSDYLQWFFWQLIAVESLMVSVERTS